MMRFTAFWVILMVCPFLLWAKPIKIRAHVHTSEGSDGKSTAAAVMKQAAEAGFDVLIVTDHFEQVTERYKDFTQYAALFADRPLTQRGVRLLVIIGAEIAVKAKEGQAHILAFPFEDWDQRLLDSNQENVLALLSQMQKVAIVAHPSQPGYSFDRQAINGLVGVEVFNDLPGLGGANFLTLNWFLALSSQGVQLSVLSGADLHGLVTDKAERVDRATIADIPAISIKEVVAAFQKNQTFATNFGVTINNFSLTGKTFKFDVFSGWITDITKTITIYRDGKAVLDSVRIWLTGKKDYHYEWEDKDVLPGTHFYVVHISTCLVSSIIRLEVAAEEPNRARGSYLLPTLLGKTKSEVKQIFPKAKPNGYSFDQNGQMVDTSWGLCFLDRGNDPTRPKPGYNLNIYFPIAAQNRVDSVSLRDEDWLSTNGPGTGAVLSARQVIPPEILQTKPYLIARHTIKDRLVVIWYINNKTFVAIVKNSRALYAKNGDKYSLTESGRRFTEADHLVFYGYINRLLTAQAARDNVSGSIYYILAMGSAGNVCFYLLD